MLWCSQRRNAKTNAAIAAFPVLLCALLVAIQRVVDSELERPPWRCGCTGGECGIQHSTPIQAVSCAVPVPPRWPALVQVPDPEARAQTRLHRRPCNASENCPATVLLTGQNRQLAEGTEHTYVCPCQNFQFAWKSCSYLGANCSVLDEFFFAVLGSLLFPPVPVQYALEPDASNSSDYLDEFSSVVPVSCLINPYFHSAAFYAKVFVDFLFGYDGKNDYEFLLLPGFKLATCTCSVH